MPNAQSPMCGILGHLITMAANNALNVIWDVIEEHY